MDIKTLFQNFKDRWMGQRVDTDNYPKGEIYQCVDLVKQFLYECFGIPNGAYGNAIDYWTKTAAIILTKFNRVQTTDVQTGDVVVLNGLSGNTAGHITIATGNQSATQYEALEQNGSTGNGSGINGDAIRTRWINKSRIAGVLRPIVASQPAAPAPTPQPSHPYSVENITPKKVSLKIDTKEWNLDNTTWGGFNTNPVSSVSAGTVVTVVAIAHHNLGGNYYMKDANSPAGFNTVDCVDYVEPVQQAPAPETSTSPSKPQNIAYTKLEQPQSLVVNKAPTHVWRLDFSSYPNAQTMIELPQGSSFIAYGKAQRTDLDRPAYFMTEADFGSADTTGIPINNNGVNTVDLSPAPAQPEAPAAAETPKEEPIVETPAATVPEAAPEAEETKVPVKVLTPANPDAWKTSYKTNAAGDYYAVADTKIYDIDTAANPEQQLSRGLIVHVAGTFTGPNGVKYYRTKKSAEAGTWYGIPQICLVAEDLDSDHELLLNNETITEAREALGKLGIREKIIRLIATLESFVQTMFRKK